MLPRLLVQIRDRGRGRLRYVHGASCVCYMVLRVVGVFVVFFVSVVCVSACVAV